MYPLERPHRRLQHQAEHEGEHDRQDDLGCDITQGKHRQHKKAAQKHCLDIRRYGQIVVGSWGRGRRNGRRTLGCLTSGEQLELADRRHSYST
jgi:hypothetical protein